MQNAIQLFQIAGNSPRAVISAQLPGVEKISIPDLKRTEAQIAQIVETAERRLHRRLIDTIDQIDSRGEIADVGEIGAFFYSNRADHPTY